MHEAMGLAFTTAFALNHVALLGALVADPQRAAAHADEAIAHSIEHRLADYRAAGRASFRVPCWPKAAIPNAGSSLCAARLQRSSATHSVNRRTLYLGHFAAAHASLGQPEVGLDLLDEAIQTAEKTNERFFEAELYRLRGEMLLTLGRRGEAEAGLRQALTIAQQQQARWWELRAASSSCQALARRGQIPEGLFAPATGLCWFDEGFDTASLKDAKILLGELRGLSGCANLSTLPVNW